MTLSPDIKAFFDALDRKDLHTAKELLKTVDINARHHTGMTGLMLYTLRGEEKVIRWLLKNGADVDMAEEESGDTALHHAADRGRERIARLLVREGADINKTNKNMETPLTVAVIRKREVIARFLLTQEKVDLDIRDSWGLSPLLWALEQETWDIAKWLIEAGADPNLPSEHLKKHNETPMIMAAMKGRFDLVKLLMKAGAELDTEDRNGKTASMHARAQGYFNIPLAIHAERERRRLKQATVRTKVRDRLRKTAPKRRRGP